MLICLIAQVTFPMRLTRKMQITSYSVKFQLWIKNVEYQLLHRIANLSTKVRVKTAKLNLSILIISRPKAIDEARSFYNALKYIMISIANAYL